MGLMFVELILFLFWLCGMLKSISLFMLVVIVVVVVLCSEFWVCCIMFGMEVIGCGLLMLLVMNIGSIKCFGFNEVCVIRWCIVMVEWSWCGCCCG